MKKRIIIIFFIIAIAISIEICSFILIKNNKNETQESPKIPQSKEENKIENKIENEEPEEEKTALEPIYCLLLGINENEGLLLTDTIMVVAYYPETEQISMLSIPRDTFIGENENSATAYDKINALYQSGSGGEKGAENILNAVSDITELEIENYVAINTAGLRKIIDAIGGVYFDVPIDIHAGSMQLEKGYQLLDGKKAEQLLRFRHNDDGTTYPSSYGQEDIGRMRTQREFLTALAKQILKETSIDELKKITNILSENIETNLKISSLLLYALDIADYNDLTFKTEYLPGTSQVLGSQKLWFYKPDKEGTKRVVRELFLNNKK